MSRNLRLLCVIVGILGLVSVLACCCSANAQTAASGPDAVPATYPSTDALPYPSTSFGPYASTADRTSLRGGSAASTYDDPPGIVHSDSGATDFAAGPTTSPLPDNPGPLYTPYGSPEAMAAARQLDRDGGDHWLTSNEPWSWQLLPTGLMYRPYVAGWREPRLGTQIVHDRNQGWMWDSTLGARVGLLRYGTDSELWPEGWQLDVEGASFVRMTLDPDHDRDVQAIDFRAGMPLTRRVGPWEFKFGYFHYCAHIGDEYLAVHPGFTRINYVRETLVLGLAAYLNPDLRVYSEAGWAFRVDGESQPWEFQFGAEWSPAEPTGPRGAPFLAVNGHLRQENDFGGNVNVRAGWQWRGTSGHCFRIGMQYFNGMSEFGEFYNTFEEQIGAGIWYDF